MKYLINEEICTKANSKDLFQIQPKKELEKSLMCQYSTLMDRKTPTIFYPISLCKKIGNLWYAPRWLINQKLSEWETETNKFRHTDEIIKDNWEMLPTAA